MAEEMVLALDTSHLKGSVAVAKGDDILCEIMFDASDTHSATLMPAVDDCLRMSRVSLDDIDLFSVVTGPGSFTGLRIGLATIKAFAAVHKRPVAPVSSLDALAAALPFSRFPVMPLVDARRGEVYAGLYDTSGGAARNMAGPCAVKPSKAAEMASSAGADGPLLVCGTGAIRYRKEIGSSAPEGTVFAGSAWSIPSAAVITAIALGAERVAYGDLADLEPAYIRPPDAKLPANCRLRPGGGA